MFSKSVEDLLAELTRVMLDAPELNDPDSDPESEMTIEEVSREDPKDLMDLPEPPRELPQMSDASTQTSAATKPITFAAPSKTKYIKLSRVPVGYPAATLATTATDKPEVPRLAVKQVTSSPVTGKQEVTNEVGQSQDPTHSSTGKGRSTKRPWLASSAPGPPPVNKTKGSTGPVATSTSTMEPHRDTTVKKQRQSSPQPRAKRRRRSRKRHRPLPPHMQPLCWNCHREGHRYSDCPEKTEQGLTKFCRRCGRTGVTLGECPTCQNQWEREVRHYPSAGRYVPIEEFEWYNQGKAFENFYQREP
ncbi:uncharacterized protein LOC130673028 [Microplitis mediator]|uniref:uncharacterized protein LOC130673028 n=1 Tax=Microplitis mediator TaxID=375433 RepID=UPI002555031C|nr:uncharacterized protein LOC130673028 [Microplitis mediator]